MTTRQTVINLLRGKTARRIRFTFPLSGTDMTIDSRTFNTVAEAIESGRITVSVRTDFDPGVGAQYDPGNVIETPPITGRWQEASVLHEATHAFFDLAQTSISAVDDEAAAYVVGSLYCRMTGLTPTRWGEITRTARGVVNGLLRHYATGAPGVPAVNRLAWHALRLFISTREIYLDGPAGLPAQVIPFVRDSYTHDG